MVIRDTGGEVFALAELGEGGASATGGCIFTFTAALGLSWRTSLRVQAPVLKNLDESLALEPVTGPSGH